MKKYLKGLLCLSLVVLLTGCSFSFNVGDTDKKDTEKTEEINNNKDDNTNTTSKDSSNDALKNFVEQSRSSVQALSNSTYTADLIARDNSLVYVYTYTNTYDSTQVSAMKKSLETAINNQKATFENVLESTKTIAPSTKSVIVEYYNGDNTLIASIEFK